MLNNWNITKAIPVWLLIPCCLFAERVTVTVTVKGEDGKPIEEADVRVVFPHRMDDFLEKGQTGKDGVARITGKAWDHPQVYVTKDGYYESKVRRVLTFRKEGRKDIYFDPSVELELREVKNPITMIGFRMIDTFIPVTNATAGYDLMKTDWVTPHGKGVVSDLVFRAVGFWLNKDDYDSEVVMSFSNEGDGLYHFNGHPYSAYKAPYEALKTGYSKEKSWKRSEKANPNAGSYESATIRIDTASEMSNYVFRVRTEMDSEGNIISAHYGKMYGDPFIGIPHEGKCFLKFGYYLNPTANDRNLECDWRSMPIPPRHSHMLRPVKP